MSKLCSVPLIPPAATPAVRVGAGCRAGPSAAGACHHSARTLRSGDGPQGRTRGPPRPFRSVRGDPCLTSQMRRPGSIQTYVATSTRLRGGSHRVQHARSISKRMSKGCLQTIRSINSSTRIGPAMRRGLDEPFSGERVGRRHTRGGLNDQIQGCDDRGCCHRPITGVRSDPCGSSLGREAQRVE
jgi:hypothetical protein